MLQATVLATSRVRWCLIWRSALIWKLHERTTPLIWSLNVSALSSVTPSVFSFRARRCSIRQLWLTKACRRVITFAEYQRSKLLICRGLGGDRSQRTIVVIQLKKNMTPTGRYMRLDWRSGQYRVGCHQHIYGSWRRRARSVFRSEIRMLWTEWAQEQTPKARQNTSERRPMNFFQHARRMFASISMS